MKRIRESSSSCPISTRSSIQVVDITGGAPELNPYFRRLVEAVSKEALIMSLENDTKALLTI